MEESLRSLCKRGASLIRVDAFGYVTKKKGTRCFFEVQTVSCALSAQAPLCMYEMVQGCGNACMYETDGCVGLQEPEVWQLLEWLESIASEYGTKCVPLALLIHGLVHPPSLSPVNYPD